MELRKNDIINLNITAMSSEGVGIGRTQDGLAVFVPMSAVGDELIVKILKVKKTLAYGKIEEIITPSPDRITPECNAFRLCGGCVYSHISYEAELQSKEKRVSDAISRIGGIDTKINPIVGAENPCRYRNKAQIPVGLSSDGKVAMGFFSRHSHRIVDSMDCMLQPEIFLTASKILRDFIEEKNISVYDEQTHTGLIRHLYLRYGEATDELMVCIVVNGDKIPCESELADRFTRTLPAVKSIIINSNKEKTNVIVGKKFRTIYGEDYISDELCGLKFLLSPQSFYQVNRTQAQRLYGIAKDYANLQGDETLIDLYCGTGTIGLSMSKACKELIGVEIVPKAIEDAKKNAKLNGVENARFICADAKDAATQLESEGVKPDVIILDPPRKGCDAELIRTVVSMSPSRVVYVSCDPATLARDLKLFAELGYITQEVTPVDMFSRTAHVESVALLSRKMVIHNMKLNSTPFEMIKNGQKKIELRLFDEKRQQIKVGDKIIFANSATEETLTAEVVKLHIFNNFKELYESLPLLQCGYTVEDVDKAQPEDMEQYYSVEEQRKYGVVGIELCRPKKITDESVACLALS